MKRKTMAYRLVTVLGILLALGSAVSSALDVTWWVTAALLGTAFFNVLLVGVFTLRFRRKM